MGTVTVQGNAGSSTFTLTLPANAGTVGQVLQTDGSGTTSWVTISTAITMGAGQLLIGQASGPALAETVTGDGAITPAGILTISKTGGVAFAPSATIDTTNASNITSGTLPSAQLGAAVTFATSVDTPLVIGGTAVGSSLTLESTSAVGTSDFISFKTGSQVERMRIATAGGINVNVSLTSPLIIGGSAVSSSLILESTSGAGTSDTIIFKTGSQVEQMRVDTNGNVGIGKTPATLLDVAGPIATNPATSIITATTYTVLSTDSSLIFNPTTTCTVTMPAASAFPGRWLIVKSIVGGVGHAVSSASSNIVQFAGGAATTTIIPSGGAQFVVMQSDGTNWNIMMN